MSGKQRKTMTNFVKENKDNNYLFYFVTRNDPLSI